MRKPINAIEVARTMMARALKRFEKDCIKLL